MRLARDSVRWRLTLWYSLALAAMLAVFAAGSFEVLRRVLAGRTDQFLEEARDAFAEELRTELAEVGAAPPAIDAALRELRFRDVTFAVLDSANRLAGTSTRTTAPDSVSTPPLDLTTLANSLAPARGSPRLFTLPDAKGGYRVAARPLRLAGAPYMVAAAQERHRMRETLEMVGGAYLLAIPVLLLLSGAGGFFLADRALSPMTAMTRRAREISAMNLHERLPVTNPRDELGELATVVNGLLARVESSFEQQRRFVADASHELRTPTAIIRAEAEIALTRDSRTEAEYREALRVVQDAGDRLSGIVEDLFLLARADAGHRPLQSELLYLDELAADAVRAMQGLAAARSIRVEASPMPEAPFTGDAELLGRMLLNLLDNAIKYSHHGASVAVTLDKTSRGYELRVIDQGPGIPAEATPHLFERFFRVDKARSRAERSTTAGAGLGLAIARWVAAAHGGTIELTRSGPDGSEFLVVLPSESSEMLTAEMRTESRHAAAGT
jgi:heavy metal sensor kinase